MSVKSIKIGSDIIFVEIDDISTNDKVGSNEKYPLKGFEGTGVKDKLIDVAEQLDKTIKSMASAAKESLREASPDEWSLEFTVGFKGEAGIPYLTKGEGSASLKISAKWKSKP